MGIFHTFRPNPPLSNFINIIWFYKGYQPSHEMERVLPDGTMQLIINLEEDMINVYNQKNHGQFKSFRGSLMSGPHSEFTVIDTACQASTIGVHFKPGGAFPFLGFPVNELHNEHVSLDEFWGSKAIEMREQILEANTPIAKFRILEQNLMEIMTQTVAHHPAVAFALKKFRDFPEQWKIADVTEQIGLSPRRFIQVFKEEVGLTPKQFCRIQRFQHVLRFIKHEEQIDWIDIAYNCGFYDQSHFIHDFQAFSGISPRTYHSHQGKQKNHVPLDG